MRRVTAFLLFVCAAACDTASDTRADPSQLIIVQNDGPRWSGTADAWTVDALPAVTIGEADAATAAYALDGVSGAARLSDGRIVVAGFNSLDLRYFDARGRHVRTVGGKGDGPGEFRLVRGIGRLGDTIVVWDAFANRVSRFDGTGAFAGSVSLKERDMRIPSLTGFLDDGSMLLRARSNGERSDYEGEYADSVTFLRVSMRTGERLDAMGPDFWGDAFQARIGHNWVSEPVIFGRRGLAAGARTGFYRAVSDRFEATFHGPDGTPVRTLRRPHTPVRATAADVAPQREAIESGNAELLRMDSGLGAVQRRLVEHIPHRSTLPAITQLRVDRRDNLWTRSYVPPDAQSAAWSVFDPQGHWLGVVQLPANLEVLEIGDDYLLATTVAPLDDVERVVLHRLRKPR